ncbi:MAG: GNAT family N-acetyltransferase [Acetobacteraceae bacterium]|nr:GNAT family N-acetyltransferase [Acetobacteraceae bacterium]
MALRPLRREDLEVLAGWASDDGVARFMGARGRDRAGLEEWYLQRAGDPRCRVMAILDGNGAVIGDIELEQIDWRNGRGELRVCIGEAARRHCGLGTDAVRTLLQHTFASLGLREVYLRVHPENAAAIRCYEKCGFRKRGFLRAGKRKGSGVDDLLLMSVTRGRFLRLGRRAPAKDARPRGA